MSKDPIVPPGFTEAMLTMQGTKEGQSAPIPPVFYEMEGQIVSFDLDTEELVARFPVLARYQNPFGSMQGGMLAAAIDNTFGPLSHLIAPPNVTRHLEIKYKLPVMPEDEYIAVEAKLQERRDTFLLFSARVTNDKGELVAWAKATHFVLPEEEHK